MRKLTQNEIQAILEEEDVNKKKDMIHQVMSESFRANNRAYITVATGVGKTYWACKQIIQGINKKNPHLTIGVVVPSRTIKDAFLKYIQVLKLKNVDVYVINTYTMSNKIEKTHDVLIIDELQHAAGQSKFFSSVIPISNAKAVLGLTATLKKSHHKFLQEQGLKHIFDLNIDEARLLGVTPDFQKFNIPIELTTEEKAEYVSFQKEIDKYTDYFSQVTDRPSELLFTLKGNKFQRNSANLSNTASRLKISEGQVLGIVKKWFEAIQGRKRVLQEAKNGKKLIIDLCKRLDGKTITFLKGIDYAEEINKALLEKGLSSTLYHSKLTAKNQRLNLQAFENDVQFMNTINALDEGYDLPLIQYGINVGYDTSELKSAQRIGRCVRFDINNPKKIAKVFNFYVADFIFMGEEWKSQQLVWLRYSQMGQNNIQWVKSIDECFN